MQINKGILKTLQCHPLIVIINIFIYILLDFPDVSEGKEAICNVGDLGSIPELGRSPWSRARQPTPLFLPEESPRTEKSGGLQSMESQRVTCALFYLQCIYKVYIYLYTHIHRYTECIYRHIYILSVTKGKPSLWLYNLVFSVINQTFRIFFISNKRENIQISITLRVG